MRWFLVLLNSAFITQNIYYIIRIWKRYWAYERPHRFTVHLAPSVCLDGVHYIPADALRIVNGLRKLNRNFERRQRRFNVLMTLVFTALIVFLFWNAIHIHP